MFLVMDGSNEDLTTAMRLISRDLKAPIQLLASHIVPYSARDSRRYSACNIVQKLEFQLAVKGHDFNQWFNDNFQTHANLNRLPSTEQITDLLIKSLANSRSHLPHLVVIQADNPTDDTRDLVRLLLHAFAGLSTIKLLIGSTPLLSMVDELPYSHSHRVELIDMEWLEEITDSSDSDIHLDTTESETIVPNASDEKKGCNQSEVNDTEYSDLEETSDVNQIFDVYFGWIFTAIRYSVDSPWRFMYALFLLRIPTFYVKRVRYMLEVAAPCMFALQEILDEVSTSRCFASFPAHQDAHSPVTLWTLTCQEWDTLLQLPDDLSLTHLPIPVQKFHRTWVDLVDSILHDWSIINAMSAMLIPLVQ
jgi:hypothetical protein